MAASTAFVAGSAMVAAPVSMDLSSCKAFGSGTSTLVHATPVSRAHVSKAVAARASSNSEVRMWDYSGHIISCSMCAWVCGHSPIMCKDMHEDALGWYPFDVRNFLDSTFHAVCPWVSCS